jgi:TolB-like protein/tetratricopeptide (TPR) repeat protein
MPATGERLDSWKEIAAHFNRDVTTVRRWERREGLPVHRHPHQSRSSVYAYRTELDAWWRDRSASGEKEPGAQAPKPLPRGSLASAALLPFRALTKAAAGAGVVLVAAMALSAPDVRVPRDTINAIAVLPFGSSAGSAEAGYVSDALSDALSDHLALIPALRVIARSSVLRETGDRVTAARHLQVDAVVTGATELAGSHLTVSVDLVNAQGRRLWQGRYTGGAIDVLGLQAALVRDVIGALGRELIRPATGSGNVDAYWTYLAGRRDWNRRTPDSLRSAARLFTRAAEMDPTFALAFAGAADAESLIGYYRVAPLDESLAHAETAARHAIALDDTIAEAHAALAHIHAARWEWAQADGEYRRALALNPNYATARHWYSNYLSVIGADAEAVTQARLAVTLDPLSPIVRSGALANALMRAGRYDEALQEYERALHLDPGFGNARLGRAIAYARKRMRNEAVREAALVGGSRPAWTAAVAAIYASFGSNDEAHRLMRGLDGSAAVSKVSLAHVYADMGDIETAYRHLREAFDDRDPDLAPALREPWFDRLRADARVIPLVQGVGLPEPDLR